MTHSFTPAYPPAKLRLFGSSFKPANRCLISDFQSGIVGLLAVAHSTLNATIGSIFVARRAGM